MVHAYAMLMTDGSAAGHCLMGPGFFYLLPSAEGALVTVSHTENIGCVDGNTIQEIGGDLVFLAPDGLRTVAGTARIGLSLIHI